MSKRNGCEGTQLVRLYTVLCVNVVFLVAELVVSHISHSLVLLVDAYHMLCNLIALVGCLITIKLCQRPLSVSNTFGWARLDVLAMLVDVFFLAALCFSLVVEAVQTMLHADHSDAMHHPLIVGGLGAAGLAVNALCICILGGFTHHQGSFLNLNSEGEVTLQTSATEDTVRQGLRRPSSTIAKKSNASTGNPTTGKVRRQARKRPNFFAVTRDITSCVLVIAVSVIAYFDVNEDYILYVDPALAIVSVLILMTTSYPLMLQAGRILMQTIPDHIDVDELRSRILENFPGVVNIHDLHVWALTPTKIYLTAHILFMDKHVYADTAETIKQFIQLQGITQQTVQPEFFQESNNLTPAPSKGCILTCVEDSCISRQCCNHCVKIPVPHSGEDVELGQSEHEHGSHCCSSVANGKDHATTEPLLKDQLELQNV